MPTEHPRISVTKDPALAAALSRVSALCGQRAREATLVHDLAILGADAAVRDERQRRAGIEDFVAFSTTLDGLDRDLLLTIDRFAWEIDESD